MADVSRHERRRQRLDSDSDSSDSEEEGPAAEPVARQSNAAATSATATLAAAVSPGQARSHASEEVSAAAPAGPVWDSTPIQAAMPWDDLGNGVGPLGPESGALPHSAVAQRSVSRGGLSSQQPTGGDDRAEADSDTPAEAGSNEESARPVMHFDMAELKRQLEAARQAKQLSRQQTDAKGAEGGVGGMASASATLSDATVDVRLPDAALALHTALISRSYVRRC